MEIEARFGRKSNVAMTAAGAFAAIGVVGQHMAVQIVAIICACITAVCAISTQYYIDMKEAEKCDPQD